jgi:hypothetical protein
MKLALGLVLTVGLAQLVSGCVAHAGFGGEVVVDEPSVVYVAPGVWVVENHNAAVFYSDGYYWQRNGSVWYRSSYYDDGFIQVNARIVPRGIYGVRNHRSYVRYRGRGDVRRARANRRYNNRAARRDNRGYNNRTTRPNVRDNRGNRGYNNRTTRPNARDNRGYNNRTTRPNVRDNRRHNNRTTRPNVRDNRGHNNRSNNNRGKRDDKRKRVRDNRR